MKTWLLVALAAAVLGGCGGGDYGGQAIGPGDACSPGGIWRASDGALGVVDNSGRTHIVAPDGLQYVGSILYGEVSGIPGYENESDPPCINRENQSPFHVALPLGQDLPDGSRTAEGNVFAKWHQTRNNLLIDDELNTGASTVLPFVFTGAIDTLYRQEPARNSLIAGSYRLTGDPDGALLTIDADGTMFSQDAVTGCVLSGTIQPKDTRFDVYRVELVYASCTGPGATLNGLPASGLAFYDGRIDPAELFMALEAPGDGQYYSVVLPLARAGN